MQAPILTFKRARALRRDMSLPEAVLWEHLRGRRLGGLRFRRQHPIGPYIVDFYCAEARLAVEVEGWVHDSPEQALHDERRQGWLARRGIKVLRFSAKEVLKDEELEGVLLMIEQTADRLILPRAAAEADHAIPDQVRDGGGGRSMAAAAAAPSTAFGGPPPPRSGGGTETAPASDARHLHEHGKVASETGFRLLRVDAAPVAWTVTHGLVPYESAVARMEARVAAIAAGEASEEVWLLEHPPLYTAGTSARPADLLAPDRFPVHRTGRGGEYTYHGPGQRVAYVMLDLNARAPDLRRYVEALEAWIVAALARLGVTGEARPGRIGIWVRRPDKPPLAIGPAEDKIAAIGIRVRRWVTFHGIALNVAPELEHFSGIVPCGIRGHGVTSLADLGVGATMEEVDEALRQAFESIFGPIMAQEARTGGFASA